MQKKYLSYLFLLASILFSYQLLAQDYAPLRQDSVRFMLRNKAVDVIKTTYSENGIKFLVVHDDENTGVEAAHQFMALNGGIITELKYGNVRNIKFDLDSFTNCEFDPNSMFTNTGAYKSLDKHASVSQEAIDLVKNLGDSVFQIYAGEKPAYIITLHNNTDSNYSIKSYLKENYLGTTAEDVFINPESDPDDLVFVTDRFFFDYLKERNVNTALQSRFAPNDGSLSVYAAMAYIPYINVEVQDGHVDENRRLIGIVNAMMIVFNEKKQSSTSEK